MELKTSKQELISRIGFDRYFDAKEWAEYNRQFFNGLAPKYDYLNEVITCGMQTRYKKQVIKKSGISDGDLVLDICTGSGDIALLAAQEYPSSHIVGIDVADEMLKIARNKSQGLRNVEFKLGDAMRIPFDDQTFDTSVMSYGLRNLSNIRQGIEEMVRVTKPGGSISIIDLGKPEGVFEKGVYKLYFETLMPLLGKYVFHRGEFNSFKYLPESNKFFPPMRELSSLMEQCGMKPIKVYRYMMGIVSQWVGQRAL